MLLEFKKGANTTGIMTLSIMTLSIMTPSITTLSIKGLFSTLSLNGFQRKDYLA